MFAQDNILSGQGPQIPTIVVPQNGAPVRTIQLVNPALPDSVLDCVAALEEQDSATYTDWAATGGSVSVGARETWTTDTPVFAADATVLDATEGRFQFQIPQARTNLPGVYLFNATLLNSEGIPVHSNSGYLEITPSPSYVQDAYPLTIGRIRRAMRDAHPRNNRILEECEFTLAEIMDTIQLTVDEYNDLNFPTTRWMMSNFPWPSKLLTGVIGHLLELAAVWYERNDLEVASAGLRADDLHKSQPYLRISDRYLQRWLQWATISKRNANIRNGWGTVRSG